MLLWSTAMSQSESWYHFTFSQNNSGGYFVGPPMFIVTARDEDEAFAILQSQRWYTDEYCECCGERWSFCEQSSEIL